MSMFINYISNSFSLHFTVDSRFKTAEMLFFDIMDLCWSKEMKAYSIWDASCCHVASDGPLVLLISVIYLRDFMASHFGCWLLFLLAWIWSLRGLKVPCLVTRHKGFLLGGGCLSVDRYGLCGALDPSDARLFSERGAFDLLKQSSMPIRSRNPNNIPLFLYEKFSMSYLALAVCGSSGHLNASFMSIWVRILLYKLSRSD